MTDRYEKRVRLLESRARLAEQILAGGLDEFAKGRGVCIQLEFSAKDLEPVRLGPYEWVQLTYNDLRISPDGDIIAWCNYSGGLWKVLDEVLPEGKPDTWSDIIIISPGGKP